MLSCGPVVEHQAEAVAFISRAQLGAVGYEFAVRRIPRRSVIRGIGCNLPGLAGEYVDGKQVHICRSFFMRIAV